MDLFFDIFWTSVGAILGLMLVLHVFRRFAAPFRMHIYLKSGKVVKINVKDFNARSTTLSWTLSKYVPQVINLPDYDTMEALKVVDRRYHF